ncbi:alpha-terpineol synthase, chloroplastic-like [Carex rostrata]
MAKEGCLVSSVPCHRTMKMKRRTANYAPNSWDYYSISSPQKKYETLKISKCYKEMKSNIRSQLIYKESQLPAKLNLVDMLQRLGVAYHFSEEIKHVLEEMVINNAKATLNNDFASLALLFRLMRENCHEVSQDILSTIMNGNVQNDIEALLSLYGASFLTFEGEKLSDEPRVFSTKQLNQLKKTCMDQKLKGQMEHALEVPLHWRVPRLDTRWYIEQCQGNQNVNPVLTKFAKLEYNRVQLVHQGELSKLTRWWIELGLREKVPFARDRLIESFFYATGIAPEPHNTYCREVLTKLAVLIVTLDDVYDIYGTLDELLLFTEVIQRWDEVEATERLPEYMRALYGVMFNTTKETASYVLAKHGWDASPILIKAWQDACVSFLTEAKWYKNGYKAKFEEYLENGWVSSTAPLLLTHAFIVLGDKTTAQALNLQIKYPRLVQSCAMIFRLTNDCATHHAELERGDSPSAIACYMQEQLCTEQQARKAIEKLIVETWTKINDDSLGHGRHALPRPLINASVNLARMSHCLYNGGDGIGAPGQRMKGLVKSLLLDSISMD